jgi:hypothetical protein
MKFIVGAVALYLVVYLWVCTPIRWTSPKRVVMETIVRAMQPLIVFNPVATIDGTIPSLDPKEYLPLEPTPPVIIIQPDTPIDVALDAMRAAWVAQDAIVIWKGFTKGHMDKWADEEYVFDTINDDDVYPFLTNFSNHKVDTLSFGEAKSKLQDLYLGFSYVLLKNNEKTLLADFNNMLAAKGSEVTDLIPVNNSIHHAFLYKGKKYFTGMHQAPVSDWFFQVSNSKTWRFVQPHYTPYMKPLTFDGTSMMSGYDFLPDDCGIPFTDVTTEAGDFMYFPPHWWHEVKNEGDGIGVAFGFRPKMDFKNGLKDILFPLMANKGLPSHRFTFFGGMAKSFTKTFFTGYVSTANDNGGVFSRTNSMYQCQEEIRSHLPNWTWDKMSMLATGECEAE